MDRKAKELASNHQSLGLSNSQSNAPTNEHRIDQVQPSYRSASIPGAGTWTVATRSVAFGKAVAYDRGDYVPSDDEIIIVTVKLTSAHRRQSFEGCDELPDRPPRRSFLRRVGTRINGPSDEAQYKAVKMTRADYKRYFAKDGQGNYVGTEPQREWTQEDIDQYFGAYKDLPLLSTVT